MNNINGNYLLFLATSAYFCLLTIALSLFNSTLSQFGIYILLPGLFLAVPDTLSKYLKRALVIISGIILDYQYALPFGLTIFFLISVYLILENQIKFSMFKSFNDHRIILVFVNLFFFLILLIISKINQLFLPQLHLFKFFTDLILSSAFLFLILPFQYSVLSLLDQKFISGPNENSYLIK